MGCQHLDDLYELYLLGSAREESAEIGAHLESGCPYCVDHLREAVQVIYVLSLNSTSVRPSRRHKAELMRRLKK